MRVERVATDQLAARAAVWLADRVWAALAERSVAHVAVSGGSTPAAMLATVATLPLPWADLHVWQVDERVAPDGDPARNARLLDPLAAAGATTHRMDVTGADLELAARRYAAGLADACGGILDVVHLGLGADGHTASWPPGDPVPGTTDRDVAVVGPYRGHRRMTLTVPVVNRARERLVLVAGADKAVAVGRFLTGDPAVPASMVTAIATTLLADGTALG